MNTVDWIRSGLAAVGIALIGSASIASMASAAFPGSNGRIAYSDGLNLFDIQPDGTDRRQLTTDGHPSSGGQNFHSNNTPSYSPDGNQLVFSRSAGRDPSFEGLFISNADGSGTRPVFRGRTSNANPSFSPDAKRIIFSDSGDIATVGVDGHGKKVIRDDRGKQDLWPSFSPNGRKIVFWRVHGEKIDEDIFVMDADGSDVKKLTRRGDNRTPEYAPDGRHIFFASDRGSSRKFRIWRMQADGDHEIPITDTPPSDQAALESQPAVSPDGQRMAYTRVDTSDVTRVFVTGPLFPLPPASTLLDPAGGTTGRSKAATWQPR